MPLPPSFVQRLYNFRKAQLDGQDFNPGWLDAELSRVIESLNQAIAVQRGITDANGRLKLQTPLREMSLIEVINYVATAGQTQFDVLPITDILTDRAEFRIQSGQGFLPVDLSAVSLAAYTAVGTVSAVQLSATYNFSNAVPANIVGSRLVINGQDAGIVNIRVSDTQVTTTTPWATTSGTFSAPAWSFPDVATATLTGVSLTAGQKVQALIFSDGAGALTQLGTPSALTGARQVAVFDFAGVIGSSNVEDALTEIFTLHYALSDALGPLTQYLKRDGSLAMTGALNGGGFKAQGFAAGTATGELVTYEQISGFIAVWNDLARFYLKRDGSTAMAGDLDMGAHQVKAVADGVDPQDAATVAQLDTRLPRDGTAPMTGDLDFGAKRGINAAPGVNPTDLATVGQIQSLIGNGQSIADFPTPGSYSFAVPTGVLSVRVWAWGGGQGGYFTGARNLGGAAGGFGLATFTVTPGEVLSIQVGAGGLANQPGGTTRILRGASVLLEVTGGVAGVGGAATSPAGLSFFGIQGGATTGTRPIGDNDGSGHDTSSGGGCAPFGGQGGCGGAGSPGWVQGPDPGVAPGGGGGGGFSNGFGSASGGAGGNGRLTIFF